MKDKVSFKIPGPASCLADYHSSLNEHKFWHNFDCLSPMYACGEAKDDTEHYLLHCPQLTTLNQNLLGQKF